MESAAGPGGAAVELLISAGLGAPTGAVGVEGIHISSVTATGAGLTLRVETGEDVTVVRTAVSLPSAMAVGRSGSMTFGVSAGRCGCSGPSASGDARTRTVRGQRSARNTRWQGRGQNSPAGPSVGRRTRCSVSIPRFRPWPISSAFPGTPPGTPPEWKHLGGSQRRTGLQVDALGVDEHVWSHTGPPGSGMVTDVVDHTRDADGTVHARLLDLVPGRSGKAYADWLKDRGTGFTTGIKTAALDPFRGYANAIHHELPEAITVLDAFHVVKLGSAMADEVRRSSNSST